MVALETAILAGLGLLNLAAIGFLAHWIRMHLDSAMMDIDEKLFSRPVFKEETRGS